MWTTLMGFCLNKKLIGIPAKIVESEFNQTSKSWKKPKDTISQIQNVEILFQKKIHIIQQIIWYEKEEVRYQRLKEI